MGTYGSLASFFGPIVALAMLAALMVLLRWTFSHGRSVVQPRRKLPQQDYLVEAGRFTNVIEAEYFHCVVARAGIDTAVKVTGDKRTLLVPASQQGAAQELLRRYAL